MAGWRKLGGKPRMLNKVYNNRGLNNFYSNRRLTTGLQKRRTSGHHYKEETTYVCGEKPDDICPCDPDVDGDDCIHQFAMEHYSEDIMWDSLPTCEALWSFADLDKDGTVTEAEWSTKGNCLHPEEFDFHDLNQDGVLDGGDCEIMND